MRRSRCAASRPRRPRASSSCPTSNRRALSCGRRRSRARAAGVEAIDCPYTFSDVKGALADARYAKQLGYRMKALVDPSHAKAVNAVFTPSRAEIARARRVVRAFEKARAAGRDRAKVGGALIEVPAYATAKRLLASAARS